MAVVTKENDTENRSRQCEEPIIYSTFLLSHGVHGIMYKLRKAFFSIIRALKASNLSQITFFILTNVLLSTFERFGPNF